MDMDRYRAIVLNHPIYNIIDCQLYKKRQKKQTESHANGSEYPIGMLGKHPLSAGKRQGKTGGRAA